MVEEHVVLVDEQNTVLGTAPKATIHTTKTPLHRGFSLFVFNDRNELLVTQRAFTKKTFPGVWSNTVCGHPALNEEPKDAAIRRLQQELGMRLESIEFVSDYRYACADVNGIVENEICPVFIGWSQNNPAPNPDEIESFRWMAWDDFLRDIQERSDIYSHWCKEEAVLVRKFLKN